MTLLTIVTILVLNSLFQLSFLSNITTFNSHAPLTKLVPQNAKALTKKKTQKTKMH